LYVFKLTCQNLNYKIFDKVDVKLSNVNLCQINLSKFNFKFDNEAFIPHKKGCLLDCLDCVTNRGACIDACFVWWRDTLLLASRYKTF